MLHHRALSTVAVIALLLTSACADEDTTDTADTDVTTTSVAPEASFIDESACEEYEPTAGIDGDVIKVGTVRPATGPNAALDAITTGIEARFKAVNASGGFEAGDGKKYRIELIKEDDGFDPARTPALVQKLVEQDQVFAMVGQLGTASVLAVRDYLNEKCVPSIGVRSGAVQMGEASAYPWTIAGLPSYGVETRAIVQWLAENKPGAKIALLYQDDGLGKSYQGTLKAEIEGTDLELVAEQPYNVLTETSPEAKVAQLAESQADTFLVAVAALPCARAVGLMPASWQPEVWVTQNCRGKSLLGVAGERQEGLRTMQFDLDPGTAADRENPRVADFLEQAQALGISAADLDNGIIHTGWTDASMFLRALETAESVTRADVMNAAFTLSGETYGLLRDDVKVTTSGADDPWAIEDLRPVERKAGEWVELGPVVSFDGQSVEIGG